MREITEKKNAAYDTSSIIYKLKEDKRMGRPLKIAFVDIDSTLTGQATVTKQARTKLEDLGYAVVFVTARTEEMVMSKSQYEKSIKLGFTRPKPRIGMKRGKHVYVDPKFASPSLVNPDIIIGSTGTQILVKQTKGGYCVDWAFPSQIKNMDIWRQNILALIKNLDPEELFVKLAPIEYAENYTKKKTNVFPTTYRVKVDFATVKEKIRFLEGIEKRNGEKPLDFLLIDDSHPEKGTFSMYITPANAYKGSAVEHVVNMICTTLQNTHADLQVLLAGDSYPDLTMLLYGASGTKATAIVVGGSRLTRILTHETVHLYAGESILSLKKKLKLRIGKSGHYNFQTILEDHEVNIRSVIFGDQAFPKTKGPETILAFLKETRVKN